MGEETVDLTKPKMETVLGLAVILFILTVPFVNYFSVLNEICQMIFGKLPERISPSPMDYGQYSIALTIIGLFIGFIMILIVNRILGQAKVSVDIKSLKGIKLKHFTLIVKGITLIVFIEELFARVLLFALPLALLGYNLVAFYVFWLLSNIVWGGLHIFNYEKKNRHILRTLPQILSGLLIFSYAFLKFGFWLAFIVHLLYNFVLLTSLDFQSYKETLKNVPVRIFALIIGYFLMTGFISFQGINIASLFASTPYWSWLNGEFVTVGVTMLSSVGFAMIVYSFVGFICDIVGLDEYPVLEKCVDIKKKGFCKIFMVAILIGLLSSLIAAILLPLVYHLNLWITVPIISIFFPIGNKVISAILASVFIIILVIQKGNTSPSAEVRAFLTSSPLLCLFLVFFVTFDFLFFFMVVLVSTLLETAIYSLKYLKK